MRTLEGNPAAVEVLEVLGRWRTWSAILWLNEILRVQLAILHASPSPIQSEEPILQTPRHLIPSARCKTNKQTNRQTKVIVSVSGSIGILRRSYWFEGVWRSEQSSGSLKGRGFFEFSAILGGIFKDFHRSFRNFDSGSSYEIWAILSGSLSVSSRSSNSSRISKDFQGFPGIVQDYSTFSTASKLPNKTFRLPDDFSGFVRICQDFFDNPGRLLRFWATLGRFSRILWLDLLKRQANLQDYWGFFRILQDSSGFFRIFRIVWVAIATRWFVIGFNASLCIKVIRKSLRSCNVAEPTSNLFHI